MIHVFIINGYAGNKSVTDEIRTHLNNLSGLKYFVFNTIEQGAEKKLVKRLCTYYDEDRIRFYACGGSGTFRNILDAVEDLSRVEIAFFPCGSTNDYLKCFDNEESFKNLDNLINGKVISVDYIQSDYGRAVNTVSIGFDSNVAKATESLKILDALGSRLPLFLSVVKGAVIDNPQKVSVLVDNRQLKANIFEVIFSNGCKFGGNMLVCEKNRIDDNKANFLIIKNVNWLLERFYILFKLMSGKFFDLNKRADYGQCETMEISSLEDEDLFINYDGEVITCGRKCKLEIVHNGLNLVVPHDTVLKEFVLGGAK